MLQNKKVLGVCMTKIHDITRAELIHRLNMEAERHGYRLMVFNSCFDFYYGCDDDIGAESIYDYINYGIVDALVIFCSHFMDRTVCEKTVERAKEHGIPVILEDEVIDGCYTIRNTYEQAFHDLLSHVIREHQVRDTFFIAGYPDNPQSVERIRIYKQVLEENGLAFEEENVDYGCFWEDPTHAVVDRIMTSGRKIPQAIFCANDSMAVACCKRLWSHGYSVPRNIIVTGFDGIRMGEFTNPQLSTCVFDTDGFLDKIFQITSAHENGTSIPQIWDNPYTVRITESCGCRPEQSSVDYRHILDGYRKLLAHMKGHEDYIYSEINNLLNAQTDVFDVNTFYNAIVHIIDQNAFLAIRPSFLTEVLYTNLKSKLEEEELVLLSRNHTSQQKGAEIHRFRSSGMVPDLDTWADEQTMYILCPVQVGKIVFGYYGMRSMDSIEDGTKLNRVLNMLNLIAHLAVSRFRQRLVKTGRPQSVMMDYRTELPNARALNGWFEDFITNPQNAEKEYAVLSFGFVKYKYIYQNYGSEAVEAALCFAAEALRIANPSGSFIAHITDDEFLVINYADDREELKQINRDAYDTFFRMMDRYNMQSGNHFYVEINGGTAYGNVSDGQKLESLIRDASRNMYKNMVRYGGVSAAREQQKITSEDYFIFHALIERNDFYYEFQPIVRVADGEIFGYEALMRTDKRIGFTPLEVLSIAADYKRLYDVEKATLFNVLSRYKKDYSSFGGKKIFINCIPGHFLNRADMDMLSREYAPYIRNVIFEITEQNSVTEEELAKLRKFGNASYLNPIAIDDYGSGHSNIVNLIRYSPEIVKIDRFLIKNISSDVNKQLAVKGVIEFAERNHIQVLAEGVETYEDLQKVIELGVQYVQGYYLGYPVENPIRRINDSIRTEILEFTGRGA